VTGNRMHGARLAAAVLSVGSVCCFASVCCVASGLALLAGRAYVETKAGVASLLIDRAFEEHRLDGGVHKPWPWADWSPIARIEVPRLGIRRPILSGASGPSLAFGLGHLDGTADPAGDGNCVLAGHRDASAAFLRDLRVGDDVRIETGGAFRDYRVARLDVVSSEDTAVTLPVERSRLTLVTCYPFGGVTHSPWRYVVTAEADPPGGGPARGDPDQARAICRSTVCRMPPFL
jgi:sortase A